jgi:hypothetical protein
VIGGDHFYYWQTPTYSLEIILFLSIFTLLAFYFLNRSVRAEGFTTRYLGSMVLKILLFSGFIVTIILLDPNGANRNVTFFLISYLLFTALEVGSLFAKWNA